MQVSRMFPIGLVGVFALAGCVGSDPGPSNPDSLSALNLSGTSWRTLCEYVEESDPADPELGTYQQFDIQFDVEVEQYHVDARIYLPPNDTCVGTEDYLFAADYEIYIGDEVVTSSGLTAYQFQEALIDESIDNIWVGSSESLIYRDDDLLFFGQDAEDGGDPNALDLERPLELLP